MTRVDAVKAEWLPKLEAAIAGVLAVASDYPQTSAEDALLGRPIAVARYGVSAEGDQTRRAALDALHAVQTAASEDYWRANRQDAAATKQDR